MGAWEGRGNSAWEHGRDGGDSGGMKGREGTNIESIPGVNRGSMGGR